MWTEDQGWFDEWGVAKRVRSSRDQLYGIARFIAYGGSWHNHYMLTGGSNFGLQAGGEVVTSYAPDTVIDSFLLRHEPRFSSYASFYQVLTASKTSLLRTSHIPKAIVLPTNASSKRGVEAWSKDITTLLPCTDTDPSHKGFLDSSQQWHFIQNDVGKVNDGFRRLENRASGGCLNAASNKRPTLLKDCESGLHLNTGVDLLWAYNTSTSHIESYAKYDCLAKGLPLGSKCRRCLDSSDGGKNLGVWDCKTPKATQQANQIFYFSNEGTGIRHNATGLCMTSQTESSNASRVEMHVYADGLVFLSNVDPSQWLKVQPFRDFTLVLAPLSVILVNQSSTPPSILFDTNSVPKIAAGEETQSPGQSSHALNNKSFWEYYSEVPGVATRQAFSPKGPLEQLALTNNEVDCMWYSTKVPENVGKSESLEAQGIDGTILSPPFVRNGTLHIFSCAMGMRNSGISPKNGKGLDGTLIKFGGVSIESQAWTSSWVLHGEFLRIFDPASTDLVKWKKVTSDGAHESSPVTWFRKIFDLPHVDKIPATEKSPAQLAYALNLTTMWKGHAYVNGFFLGRYWLLAGKCQGACAPPIKQGHCYMHWKDCGLPTQTLYHVPTSILKPTGNLVVLFEEVGHAPSGAPLPHARNLDGVEIVALRKHL